MSATHSNLDDEARAELLTYMVVSQLVARSTANAWLGADHLRESAYVWCDSNGARCDVDECMRIADKSEALAIEFRKVTPMQNLQRLREMFTDGWRLDYRSPLVRGMFDVCREKLLLPNCGDRNE